MLDEARTDTQKEEGASMLEYALLVSLIGAVIIAAMTRFQQAASKQFSTIVDTL